MKKITNLIKESLVDFDTVEDVMIHLEDMGFKIESFNDVSGMRGYKKVLFSTGELISKYTQMNTYSHQPDEKVDNYVTYIIRLIKEFHPFTDCELYGKVVSESEVIKKRLNNCIVYYRIDTSNIRGNNTDGGSYGNTRKNLSVIFHITDKSKRVEHKSIMDRKKILNYFQSICRTYHNLASIASTEWTEYGIILELAEYGESYAKTIKEVSNFIKSCHEKVGISYICNYKLGITSTQNAADIPTHIFEFIPK